MSCPLAAPSDVDKVLLSGADLVPVVVDRYPAQDHPDNPLNEAIPIVRPPRMALAVVHPRQRYTILLCPIAVLGTT